jgi:hypothetical protein
MRRYAFPILVLTVVAASTPATAQVQRAATARTTATTAIVQPAMITSSQDLTFVISASTAGALTLGTSSLSAPTTNTRVTTTASRTSSGSTKPTSTPLLQTAAGSLGGAVPAPARATFVVAGDSGQSISVIVPDAVDLTREGGMETAVLTTENSLGDGPQFLGGDFAATGALSFNVGGQVTLANANVASGTYNGVLAVIAQYN